MARSGHRLSELQQRVDLLRGVPQRQRHADRRFSIPLAGEQPYTLAVYGTADSPSATLLSEVAKAPTNGNIQLSVFNAAVNQPTVDIYVNPPGTDITQSTRATPT